MRKMLLFFFFIMSFILRAQTGGEVNRLKFYSDSEEIDQAFLRQEVTFINYVRERLEADVHLLVTTQDTGGGGEEFTLTFVGQKRFSGINDTLVFVAQNSETREEIRKKMIRMITLGLVPYAAQFPVAERLSVIYEPGDQEDIIRPQDKWHNWVFSIELDSHIDGEKSAKQMNLGLAFRIVRITDLWKILLAFDESYDEARFDHEEVHAVSISKAYGVECRAARSLGNHWSIGTRGRYSSSTFSNIRQQIFAEPKIEYNIFPYTESTRQQLRINYGIQPIYQEYVELTIYDKMKEMLFQQNLQVAMEMVKPWGAIELSLDSSSYLHDVSKNNLDLNSEISVKVIRGLSLDIHAGIALQRNQLGLAKRDATVAEVLLQRRELESQYDYYSMVGFTYSFGALYNDIVNPRFGDWD